MYILNKHTDLTTTNYLELEKMFSFKVSILVVMTTQAKTLYRPMAINYRLST